jgi:hypothetical protein
MIKKTYWRSGSWNVICDVCGEKFKADQLRKRWDGLMVCSEDWEIRHPQDLIRPIKERNSVPWTRPRPTDIEVLVCSLAGINGVAGVGIAGCAVAGNNNNILAPADIDAILYPPTFNLNTL